MRSILQRLYTVIAFCFFTISASLAQVIPPYLPQNGLVGWWPFNGNAFDESIGTNDGAVEGASLTTDRFGVIGSAYSFDGLSDRISFANAVNFEANSFTISLYCLARDWGANQTDGYSFIFGTPLDQSVSDQGIRFFCSPDRQGVGGAGFVAVIGDNQANFVLNVSQQPFSLNTWYHLTLVYDRNINLFKLFVDGELAISNPVDPLFGNVDNGESPTIGASSTSHSSHNFNGKIDDIAVWGRALTDEEVFATYNACRFSIVNQPGVIEGLIEAELGSNIALMVESNQPDHSSYIWQKKVGDQFADVADPTKYSGTTSSTLTIYNVTTEDATAYRCVVTAENCVVLSDEAILEVLQVPTEIPSHVPTDGLVGWWPFNGNAHDESGNGRHISVNGATLTSDRSGLSNSAYSFDGVDDYLQVNIDQTASFTISIWLYLNSSDHLQGVFQHKYPCLHGGGTSVRVIHGMLSSSTLNCGGCPPNLCDEWSGDRTELADCSTGVWKNIVLAVDGVDKYLLFINGVLVDTYINSALVSDYPDLPFILGKVHDETAIYLDGKIDDVGVWRRALTQSEITTLYNTCDVSITSQPVSTTLAQGASHSVSVGATSAKSLTYQWQKDDGTGYLNVTNGESFSGATTSMLSISSFSSLTAGSFRCIVSNVDCIALSEVSLLSLSTSPGTASCVDNSGTPNPWPWPTSANAGYIDLGNLGQQQKFSVSMWVKPAAFQPSAVTILMDCSHGGSVNWCIQTLNSGTTWTFLGNEWEMTPNVWHHLLVTYDGGLSKVYVDGSLVDQDTWVIQWSGTQDIYLGNWPEGGRRFMGLVDEVMITRNILYTKAFSPKDFYTSGDVPTNTLGLWHFDEGSGFTTVNDVTGSATTINNWTWATRNVADCDVTIDVQPSGGKVGQGQSVTLSISAGSAAQLHYKWQRDAGAGFVDVIDGGSYSGSATPELVIEAFTNLTVGSYRCVVSATECSKNSDAVSLTLNLVPSYVPTDGLVSWWSFDNTLNDNMGTGNTIELRGDASMGTDRFGQESYAYKGNGNSGATITDQQGFPLGNSARSVSVWFTTNTSTTAIQNMFAWGNNTTGGRFGLFRIGSSIGVEFVNVSVVTPIPLDYHWHHLVVVYPESGAGSKDVQLYLDGEQKTTMKNGNINTLSTVDVDWIHWIGTLDINNPWFYSWNGSLDDIGLWSRALSSAEVVSLYNACNIEVTIHPSNQAVTDGQQVYLSVSATSGSAIGYQWQRKDGSSWVDITNDSRYFGATTSSLTIESAQASKSGPYRCVVSSVGCSVTSNEAMLTVSCYCND